MAEGFRWELVDPSAPADGALFATPPEIVIGRGEFAGMEFLHVRAKKVINSLPAAARMPFRHTINAYRGCSHACTYCFARPTHEYLGLDAGRDFERRIVVKLNAVERVRAELDPRRWAGEPIAMGTNTDPYQRCEGKYHLTRGIVEELSRARNPFSILTKGTLILRDLDVLAEAARRTHVRVNLSIGTLDEEVWKLTEPGTPHPLRRVEAVARLREAGLSVGVLVAPVLPGLSDDPALVEATVRACLEAGAESVSAMLLHLRPGVREQFEPWLASARPDLVEEYRRRYPKAYATKADAERLQAVVAAAVERWGGGRSRRADGFDADHLTVRPAAPATAAAGAAAPPDEQLALSL